jgi:hypothetical protein
VVKIMPLVIRLMCLWDVVKSSGNAGVDGACPRWPGENLRQHYLRYNRFYSYNLNKRGADGLEIAIVELDCGHLARIYADNRLATNQPCICSRHGMTKVNGVKDIYDGIFALLAAIPVATSGSDTTADEDHLIVSAQWGGW